MGSDNGEIRERTNLSREIIIFFAGSLLSFIVLNSDRFRDISSLRGYSEFSSLLSSSSGGPWKAIHVYYGSINHLYDKIDTGFRIDPSPNHKGGENWLGQFGQDVAVGKFFKFKKNGFFVDLASNHAFKASNTFTLEQNYGWKGICIEPNPIYWKDLSYRSCEVVAAVIGEEDMREIEVSMSADAGPAPYGGIVGKDFKNKNVRKEARTPEYSVTLKTILDRFRAPRVIDFLSLDIEGAELFVMQNFPFEQYTFLTLAIESPNDRLQKLLADKGYKQVYKFKKGADIMYAHKSVFDKGMANIEKNTDEIENHVVKVY